MNNNVCDPVTYFALTLDPVHVGVGGYRLGHVDNTILRDPPTNLPKIPGSSISGVARAYVAMKHADEKTKNGLTRLDCAGKGGDSGDRHCGEPNCPVCVPFGFSKGEGKASLHGMAQFFDARLLFFPIHSLAGPVWITSPETLAQARMKNPPKLTGKKVRTAPGLAVTWNSQPMFSLGWLLMEVEVEKDEKGEKVKTKDLLPAEISIPNLPASEEAIQTILNRLVLVPDDMFSRIVNDHLEIRTSVSINPRTGAAEEGALFTFEAIPRGALLFFEVAYNNPAHFQINGKPIPKEIDMAWVQKHVESGFEYFQSLGVGGMNTRGMGRLRIFKPAQ
jgi:CRISPR-associated protein Cmr4